MGVIKFAYPGITGKQLQNQFKSEFLPAPEHIGIVIVHVGTNNASTFKHNQPRWDENHERAQDMNAKIKKTLMDQKDYWTNVEFGDFSQDLNDIRFYRYNETQYHPEPDPVHLSPEGAQRFQEILNTQIKRLKALRESPDFAFDDNQLKTEAQWMYWRKETYGLRAPRRFKITNFAPAIEEKLC